jgi:hypothetical protein
MGFSLKKGIAELGDIIMLNKRETFCVFLASVLLFSSFFILLRL